MLGRRISFMPVALAVAVSLGAGVTRTAAAPRPSDPRPALQSFQNLRHLDVNRANLFVSNFGSFGYDLIHGGPGLFFPRGQATALLFAGGLWIGDPSTGNVALAEYTSEYAPGRILAPGVPESPSAQGLLVYKVVPWTGNPADSAHVDRTPEELAADPDLDALAHHSWSEYVSGAGARGAPVRNYRLPITDTADPADSIDVPGPDVVGDQMLWCVFNDADPALHTNLSGSTAPLGVEVQQTLYAFDRPGPLGNTLFVRYSIVNRTGVPGGTRFAGIWLDPDLGHSEDDLVGSDVGRNLGYVYNDGDDAIYGASPPALGVRMMPYAYSVTEYVNGTDPQDAAESLNALRGLHPDGSPIDDPVVGGPTRFVFPGNPATGAGWLDPLAADKRMIVSAAIPGDTAIVEAAFVIGEGPSARQSVTALQCFAEFAERAHASNFTLLVPDADGPCPPRPSCARAPAFWDSLCQRQDARVPELAGRIDRQSTYFNWSGAAAGFSAAVSAAGTGARRDAEREYAALLANLLSSIAPVVDDHGDSVSLDPATPTQCEGFVATRAGELIDPGTRTRILTRVEYRDGGDHAPTLRGIDFGLPFFDGGAGYAKDLFASSLDPNVQPDSFGTVEIRWQAAPAQKAYRYLRRELSGTGEAPASGRGFTYAGFHDVPFEVWDVARGIQLDVGFTERALVDADDTLLPSIEQPATNDSMWNPDTTRFGGREYLFVFRRAYSETPDPALAADGAIADGVHPVLYALTPRRDVPADPFDEAGDTLRFVFERPLVFTADGRMIELEDRLPKDPATIAAYEAVVGCLAPLNRTCTRSTPVLASLAAATVEDGGVVLRGWAPELVEVAIEKRTGALPWLAAARVAVDGRGAWEWRDADVRPGVRYGYRLRVGADAVGETWVTLDDPRSLALVGASPNPGGADAVVRFTLARRSPARLELIDVAGRRISSHEVGSLGPGVHAIRFPEWNRLAPGVYLMRLTQGGAVATSRVVRIR